MRIKAKKLGAYALAGTMMLTMLAGCGGSSSNEDTTTATDDSNGATEGFNNKIKVLKRVSFGMRNFKNFKARIMLLNRC